MGHAPVNPCWTVNFYIVLDGEKVVMVHHKKMNRWLCPGGHVEPGENPEEALKREILEETGMKDFTIIGHKADFNNKEVKSLHCPIFMDIHDVYGGYQHIGLIYFVRANTDRLILSDEHYAIDWFTTNELRDPQYKVPENNIYYADIAIQYFARFDVPPLY